MQTKEEKKIAFDSDHYRTHQNFAIDHMSRKATPKKESRHANQQKSEESTASRETKVKHN